MMEERAKGIVLRVRPLTETSLIAHWLTATQGRLSTVAKGARRPKSAFRGKLDLFHTCELSFARSRRSDLHTLRELQLMEARPSLRQDMGRLRQAGYAARLVELATEADTPVPSVFALVEEFLGAVCADPPRALTVMAFELRLLAELGLTPDLDSSRLSPGGRQIARRCVQSTLGELKPLVLSSEQGHELAGYLKVFLACHLGKVPENRGDALGVDETGRA